MEQLWSCSSLPPRWLALAGSRAAGQAAFPSSKTSWFSLNNAAKVQWLRGTARISWEKLGSVLNTLEIEMEISKDQTSSGNFQSYVVLARPENPS